MAPARTGRLLKNNRWIDEHVRHAMRHQKKTIKLGRTAEHRKALLANQVCSLIEHQRIQTTLAKAKAVRPLAEKMVTLGKKGSIHARRTALATSRRDRRSATAVTHALSNSANARATPLPWHSSSGSMAHKSSRKKPRKKRRRNEKRSSQAQNKKNPLRNQKNQRPKKKNRRRYLWKSQSRKSGNGSAKNQRSRENNFP